MTEVHIIVLLFLYIYSISVLSFIRWCSNFSLFASHLG